MNLTTLKAGASYFAVVFVAGFLFGLIRIQWAVPRFGMRTAELIEMPFMLLVTLLAARLTISKFAIRPAPTAHLAVGLIALGLLLIAEFGFVLWIRNLTLSDYFATKDPISGTVYFVMLGVYALMPWLVYRRINKKQ